MNSDKTELIYADWITTTMQGRESDINRNTEPDTTQQMHMTSGNRLDELQAELPESEIRKLQRIQNITATIVPGVNKDDRSSTTLKTRHWLPVHMRIKHKVLNPCI